jgi:YD repeat-containing protein
LIATLLFVALANAQSTPPVLPATQTAEYCSSNGATCLTDPTPFVTTWKTQAYNNYCFVAPGWAICTGPTPVSVNCFPAANDSEYDCTGVWTFLPSWCASHSQASPCYNTITQSVSWYSVTYSCPAGFTGPDQNHNCTPPPCIAGAWGGTGSLCSTYKESCPATPHPIILATGNKRFRETDIPVSTNSEASLRWDRYFNGVLLRMGGPEMSSYWTHSFSYHLQLVGTAIAYVLRPDGRVFGAASPGAATQAGLQLWTSDSDVVEQVYQEYNSSLIATGWLVVATDGSVETYDFGGNLLSIDDKQGRYVTLVYSSSTGTFALDSNWNATSTSLPPGLLIGVIDNFGRSLTLGYNVSSQLVQVTDPAGLNYRYTYDGSGNLSTVVYPDGKARQYLYNESAYTGGASLPNSVTGILDENGTRYASYWYNSAGQATQEVHWADSAQTKSVDQYQVTQNANGTTTMTDPLNSQTTFSYQVINGVHFPTSQSQPAGAGCGPASSSASYDANGNAQSRTDFNGNVTTESYDTTRNLETARTDAYGTAQARTISTRWHPTFRVKAAEAAPLKRTYWVYDGQPDPTNSNATLNCAPTSIPSNAAGALLHFDGANGGTTFTDVLGHSFSIGGGSPVTSSAELEFGSASLFPGSSGYIATPGSNDWVFSGDYTMEMWQYVTNTTDIRRIMGQSSWQFHHNQAIYFYDGSGWNNLGSFPGTNVWFHVAVSRHGSTSYGFINGILTATWTNSASFGSSAEPLWIGHVNGNVDFAPNMYIDDIRITNGIALYTANFTPPTAPETSVTASVPNLLANGVPPAVLCKKWESATTDTTGASGFSAALTGNPRIWTYQYNQYGQMTQSKSPRTDVNGTTTYQYYVATDTGNSPPSYQMGDRQSVTDALNHTTQFTKYDGNGRLLESVDPNGMTTDYAYFPRGWLQTVTVKPAGGGTALVTSYQYDGVGQLTQTTMPDGSYVQNTYDAAHRLTQVTDSAGDTVIYTLDAMGNRQAEQWKDPGGTLKRNIARSYDALNRLQQVTGAPQ